MSQLQVTPRVLADASGALRAEHESVGRTAAALIIAAHSVAGALPGSRTATEVESRGTELAAAVRAAAAELAVLAAALGAAATAYLAVDEDTAAGLERAGRRPS
jgi:hypothetical protein